MSLLVIGRTNLIGRCEHRSGNVVNEPCPKGRARLCLSWYYYTAPPVAGWAARSKAVEFRGKMDPRRFAIKAANMLTPPIVFEMARKMKEKLSGKKD